MSIVRRGSSLNGGLFIGERAQHPPGDLERALAELQAEIYRVPVERLMEHGRLRAEAMTIRDTRRSRAALLKPIGQRLMNCCTNPGIHLRQL